MGEEPDQKKNNKRGQTDNKNNKNKRQKLYFVNIQSISIKCMHVMIKLYIKYENKLSRIRCEVIKVGAKKN